MDPIHVLDPTLNSEHFSLLEINQWLESMKFLKKAHVQGRFFVSFRKGILYLYSTLRS